MNNHSFQVNTPNVVYENIDGETVLINLETGTYYSMLNTAGEIWEYLEKGHDKNAIITDLIQRYDTDLTTLEIAVNNLILQLIEERLIINNPSNTNTNLPSKPIPNEKLPFTQPLLEKYTDMQDLLLLDPIHEVDEMGWPNPKVNI
jgi:Coenzyme PQQ synthesis protein D (PqqD)